MFFFELKAEHGFGPDDEKWLREVLSDILTPHLRKVKVVSGSYWISPAKRYAAGVEYEFTWKLPGLGVLIRVIRIASPNLCASLSRGDEVKWVKENVVAGDISHHPGWHAFLLRRLIHLFMRDLEMEIGREHRELLVAKEVPGRHVL